MDKKPQKDFHKYLFQDVRKERAARNSLVSGIQIDRLDSEDSQWMETYIENSRWPPNFSNLFPMQAWLAGDRYGLKYFPDIPVQPIVVQLTLIFYKEGYLPFTLEEMEKIFSEPDSLVA